MRRLFVEVDRLPDPVIQDLETGFEQAHRRGVSVLIGVRGEPIRLPADVRRAAVAPVLAALATTRHHASVTVFYRHRELRLGVVGDGPALQVGVLHPAVDVDVRLREGRRRVVARATVNDRSRTDYRSSTATGPS